MVAGRGDGRGSLSDVLLSALNSMPADVLRGSGGQEAPKVEAVRKPPLRGLDVLENPLGVRTVVSWHFGTGHRRQKFGKEVLCFAGLLEAGLGLISEPHQIGIFFFVSLS